MNVRTKIVATVGPASRDRSVLHAMAQAGVDVFRLNFSHGTTDQHAATLGDLRAIEASLGRPLTVLADLCGPKIRVGPLEGGSMRLVEGASVTIRRGGGPAGPGELSTTLDELIDAAAVGQTLLLDDGRLALTVTQADGPERIVCRVRRGGDLTTGKGINLPETELALPALTEKDRRDAAFLAEADVDLVALSFVQRPEDLADLRALLPPDRAIVAKIEKPQALRRIEAIVAAADAVMVARGDLGVELALPQVPLAQKRLAALCRRSAKPCIVATQMLESMIQSPSPTRAEVSDIANAVLDGADAVMLSGETAVGAHPVLAVTTMNAIAAAAEEYDAHTAPAMRATLEAAPTEAALASAVHAILQQETIAAVACFTAQGSIAAVLAKQRLGVPILAMSPSMRVVRQMNLLYGVEPVCAPAPEHTRDVLALAQRHLTDRCAVARGQKIVVVTGRPLGGACQANTLVVHTVA